MFINRTDESFRAKYLAEIEEADKSVLQAVKALDILRGEWSGKVSEYADALHQVMHVIECDSGQYIEGTQKELLDLCDIIGMNLSDDIDQDTMDKKRMATRFAVHFDSDKVFVEIRSGPKEPVRVNARALAKFIRDMELEWLREKAFIY